MPRRLVSELYRKTGRKNGPQSLRLAVRLTNTSSGFKRFDVSTVSDIRPPAGKSSNRSCTCGARALGAMRSSRSITTISIIAAGHPAACAAVSLQSWSIAADTAGPQRVIVVDVFARRIVGWPVSASLCTDFVLDALEQAICERGGAGAQGLVHRSVR